MKRWAEGGGWLEDESGKVTSPKFTQQHLRSPGPPWRVGALDLMRDPVELLERCCLREMSRLAEGGGGASVCVGVYRTVVLFCRSSFLGEQHKSP